MSQLPPAILSGLRRLNIHVTAVLDPFPTGRPDRAALAIDTDAGPLVIKRFPSSGRWDTFDHMIRLWQSSFGLNRLPPGLPRPIAYLEQDHALVMERIPGCPMIERMGPGTERIAEIARTLADLHASDANPPRRRNAKRVVRSVQRKVADLSGTGVEHHLTGIADRLAERVPEVSRVDNRPVDLVPSHGDFSPRNVMVSPERIALIDWDRFRRADPARDLAFFGALIWSSDLSADRKPDWSLGDRLIETYQAHRPISNLEGRIAFYRAAGLARIAHSQVRLWKSAKWVAPLAAEALRLLA